MKVLQIIFIEHLQILVIIAAIAGLCWGIMNSINPEIESKSTSKKRRKKCKKSSRFFSKDLP